MSLLSAGSGKELKPVEWRRSAVGRRMDRGACTERSRGRNFQRIHQLLQYREYRGEYGALIACHRVDCGLQGGCSLLAYLHQHCVACRTEAYQARPTVVRIAHAIEVAVTLKWGDDATEGRRAHPFVCGEVAQTQLAKGLKGGES